MPYISRPTEDAVERRLNLEAFLQMVVRSGSALSLLDWNLSRLESKTPGDLTTCRRRYNLPTSYIERRLQLVEAQLRLDALGGDRVNVGGWYGDDERGTEGL